MRQPYLPLTLFNTLGARAVPFAALNPPKVTLYTCGPTVYDTPHIGNFRAYVCADILKRVLTYNGFVVNHTMNLTDFGHLTDDADAGEDKMMLALRRAGKAVTLANMRAIAEQYGGAFIADMDAIGNLPPTRYTKASDYIPEQIALISTLAQKGYTYKTSDGVYFDISRFPQYGALGNINLAAQKEGARVALNPEKKHPADFALWKFSPLGWESAWGKGFPGWHIECTAMVFATLGKQIDIHTGGIDLIATHHNGEIAQAEAATGKSPYVRFWMHNEFISIDGTKIAKSLGNGITLRQLRDRGFSPRDYRYLLLTSHYRSPTNFTFEALAGAKQALYRLKRYMVVECLPVADVVPASGSRDRSPCTLPAPSGAIIESFRSRFHEALNNDLNMPAALAIAWELVKDHTPAAKDKAATLAHFDEIFGFGLAKTARHTAETLGIIAVSDLSEEIQTLLQERERARKQKKWDEADALREAINLKGFLVVDTPKGVRVTKA